MNNHPAPSRAARAIRPTARPAPVAGGYTLVEVSLALLVMSVGLVSVLSVFPVALRWAGQTNANVMAASASRALVQEIAVYFANPAAGSGVAIDDPTPINTTPPQHFTDVVSSRSLVDADSNGQFDPGEYDDDVILSPDANGYGFWLDPVLVTTYDWGAQGLIAPPDATVNGKQPYTLDVYVYAVEPDPADPNYDPEFHDLGVFRYQVYLGEAPSP